MGLYDYVKAHNPVLDRDTAKTPEERMEIMRKGLTCDTFIMGTNAATQDGQLYNIDGNGNRTAALIFGPKQVIVIVGMNKVEPTLEAAISRARSTNSSCCGLGGGEDTGDDTDDHEHDGQHAPDGLEERLDAVLQVELSGDRDVHLLGVVVGVDHQHDAQHSAGHVAGHEQLADGDGGDTGSCQREDDHVLRRGNQNAFHGGCHGQAGRELAVIALLFHHLDLDGAKGGAVCGRRTGDAAEEEGCHHVDHGSAAVHPADQLFGKIDQGIGDAAGAHQLTHQDEEGHGQQGIRVQVTDKFQSHLHGVDAQIEEVQQRCHADGVDHRHTEEHQHQEHAQQQDGCDRCSRHLLALLSTQYPVAHHGKDVQHAGHGQCAVHEGIRHIDACHVVVCALLCQLDAVHDQEDGKAHHTDSRQDVGEEHTGLAQLFVKHGHSQMLVLAHHQHTAQQAQPHQAQQGERLAPHGRVVQHITPEEDVKDHGHQCTQNDRADVAQDLEQCGVDLFPNGSEFVHNRLLIACF